MGESLIQESGLLLADQKLPSPVPRHQLRPHGPLVALLQGDLQAGGGAVESNTADTDERRELVVDSRDHAAQQPGLRENSHTDTPSDSMKAVSFHFKQETGERE